MGIFRIDHILGNLASGQLRKVARLNPAGSFKVDRGTLHHGGQDSFGSRVVVPGLLHQQCRRGHGKPHGELRVVRVLQRQQARLQPTTNLEVASNLHCTIKLE